MNDPPKDPLVADPPFLSYSALGPRQPGDPVEVEEEENEGVGAKAARYVRNVEKIFAFVTGLILGTVLLIWAVVGAVFWIPLMIRALIRFSISLIEAMFEGHKPARAAKVLRDAVANRGTTLRDYRDAAGEAGRNAPLLRVYGREGQACVRCGGTIQRIVLSNRSAFFCPRCQPTP